MKSSLSIAARLTQALAERGVNHVFGIPGDYALGLFAEFEQSSLNLINTCDEQGAGFAADAYARISGLGAVCVTYGVGGLKLVNSTAQAYAERSPVVVISGAPGIGETSGDALLHHRVRDFGTQMRVFREITAAQAVLDDPTTAASEIERVLDVAVQSCRPVYIEVPRDCAARSISSVGPATAPAGPHVDPATLAEAVDEATAMLNQAERPMLLLGVEIHRFKLQDKLIRLIGKSGIRFATTIMGKSVINEELPGFVGVYAGSLSNELTRAEVEQSDCILNLGAMLTDLNTGIFTANLDPAKMIQSTADALIIRRHHYPSVDLATFLSALGDADLRHRDPLPPSCHAGATDFTAQSEAPISVARMFECLDANLSKDVAVIADPGDALFGAIDLTIHSRTEFIACAYYASLGFAVPAAIAVELAQPNWRPLVLVGDGAFQMTGLELTTAVRNRLSPIVIVLDNDGFGTERPMVDGEFNDVYPWKISAIPELLGSGQAYFVEHESDFEQALSAVLTGPRELALIHVKLAKHDISPALERLTNNLSKRV